jgi:NADPH2:quinone reductase
MTRCLETCLYVLGPLAKFRYPGRYPQYTSAFRSRGGVGPPQGTDGADLVRRVFRVPSGAWVVFHSAAGGVGVLAGQWLRSLGVRAIGIVGAQSKVVAAPAAGHEAVFVRGRDDWPARVRELSGGGVPVVYDCVGRDTWEGSLSCLAGRGHMVCFGNSSGLVPPFRSTSCATAAA